MASLPATRWSPTGRTSCKEARTLSREAVHRARTRQHPSRERWSVQEWDRKNQGQQNLDGVRIVHLNGEQAAIQLPATRPHESLTHIYSPPGCNHAAGGLGCVHAVTGISSSGGRLSDDPGSDVLSGSRPGRDGFLGDLAAGAAVRPGTRTDPDDLDEFIWQFGDHTAVRTRSEH